jgi:hypothetical protein
MTRLALILFVSLPYVLSAQEFVPGWIVLQNGDTLRVAKTQKEK